MNLCSNDTPIFELIPCTDIIPGKLFIEKFCIKGNALSYLEELKQEAERGSINMDNWVCNLSGGTLTITDKKIIMELLQKGDYVVATKYPDGDPNDHFCVGFFDSMTWHHRYNIVDNKGQMFRFNGFRKAKRISDEVGVKIVSHIKEIEQSNRSVWDWVAQFEEN